MSTSSIRRLMGTLLRDRNSEGAPLSRVWTDDDGEDGARGEALVRSAPGGRGRKEAERSARRLAAGPRGKAEGTLFTSRSRSASRRLPSGRDGHRGAGGVLPPGHLGQPLGHIGPFRIQRARPLKGGRGVGKPSLG
jgi:hypothetical protein